MFKIKIQDFSHYKYEKQIPYSIRYELSPDADFSGFKIHESRFSCLKTAHKVAADLSRYLTDSYFFLDLVYSKIKQLEYSYNLKPEYLCKDLSHFEIVRSNLLKTACTKDFAYNHIAALKSFIYALKDWCFIISESFKNQANAIYHLLEDFQISFINTYRSASENSENKQLKIFI